MINAIGFIGKLAEFIAQEFSKKKIARDADKKGQACQIFTRLYFILVDLQAATDYVCSGAKSAIEQNRPGDFGYYLRDSLRHIKETSNDYIETFSMLQGPLEIYAPDLSEALGCITAWKGNILWELSRTMILETENNGVSFVRLKYLKPEDKLLEIDIGAYVKRVVSGEARLRAEQMEWPETLLYSGDINSSFTDAELRFVGVDELKQFIEILEHHAAALKVGKVALRDYIKGTFSIEEVLYEKKQIEPHLF